MISRRFSSIPAFSCDNSLSVTPRPPIPDEVKTCERWQRRRLSMKPGITCLWQVSGRNAIDFDDWMRLDLAYIDTWSKTCTLHGWCFAHGSPALDDAMFPTNPE